MAQSSIPLEPDLEARLRLEAMRQKKPPEELLHEALRRYLRETKKNAPPGAGAFASGHSDTAERAEELLGDMGFGEGRG